MVAKRSSGSENFETLGVDFDCGLTMVDAIHKVTTEAQWKVRTLVRSAKYHRDAELVLLYKARVLSYLEYRTAAVYHAMDTALLPLNAVQERFLRKVGVSELEALMVFNLAPLATRRDMAMLGVVHRAALRKGPSHFWKFFQPERDATHLH